MKAALVLMIAAPAWAAPCESLASLKLPDTTITSAKLVDDNALPVFCRVAATLAPSTDSDIKLEVWLPASGWNGKYQAVGNGSWAGSINEADLAKAIQRGYAASSTDTGHTGSSGRFALGHPEKLVDFGWRSEHEMTVKAKALIAAFYGDAPSRSYWIGCSSGGKQGLKEAQRFPDDFDGVVAGAPVLNWTHRAFAALWVAQAALKDPSSHIPNEKYALIHRAAIEACDAMDGLKDGLISDPPHGHFDPAVLECKGADEPACLTPAQVQAARKIYTPLANPRTGELISARYEPGSEMGWGLIAGGPQPLARAVDHFRFVVFKDPEWDWRSLNFDTDVTLADKIDDGMVNATDPNLTAFVAHGGRLLMYQGYNDTNLPPEDVIAYYESVARTLGAAKTAEAVRLYMAPGMNHCRGGEGPNDFDMTAALEQWVENGRAPREIIASHNSAGKIDRTRPLCPYPQMTRYKGAGSIDEAANFSCVAP